MKFNFQLIYFVDTDGHLHIEHYKFIDLVEDFVDITTDDYNYVGDYSKYTFNKDLLYSRRVFEDINSAYEDFLKSEITFPKITTNKRTEDSEEEYKSQILSSDVQYVLENPTDLDNGILLILTETVDSVIQVKKGIGGKSKQSISNGDLSNSSLLLNYGRYEGVWTVGNINGEQVNFDYTLRCKDGSDIILKGIIRECFLLTKIGIAIAKSKTYDYNTETTVFVPVYRHFDEFLVNETDNLVGY